MKIAFIKLCFVFIILLTLKCPLCFAQNLIPNGDFELGPDSSSAGWVIGFPWDTTGNGCSPTTWVSGPDFWTIVSYSPDRLVEDNMPICSWTSDTAYSGEAYCVFVSGNNNYSEAGKATLSTPLKKDTIYLLHYCISLQTFDGFGTSPAQIAFIFNNSSDSIISPLIYIDLWQCFDTIFSASNNATEITVRAVYPIGTGAGMNVDNLTLQKWTSTAINEFDNLNTDISLFPNPVNGIVNIKTNNKIVDVEICDLSGRLILKDNKPTINISGYDAGVYFIKIKTDKKYSSQKIIIQ
jgi:hypothetical protein